MAAIFTFHAWRAKVDGKSAAQLVKFIQRAKHCFDVALHDKKNPDALEALKAMYTKVQFHIFYDAGTTGANSTTVGQKLSTSAVIKAASIQRPYSATFLLTHNPPFATFPALPSILNISCCILKTICDGVE